MRRSSSYRNIDEGIVKKIKGHKNLTWGNSISTRYFDPDIMSGKCTIEYDSESSSDSLECDPVIDDIKSQNYMYLSSSINYSKQVSEFNNHTAIPLYKALDVIDVTNRTKQILSSENHRDDSLEILEDKNIVSFKNEEQILEPIVSEFSNSPDSDIYYYSIPCLEHIYIDDHIDIDPDNSKCIRYCNICGHTDI
jgi:hypothetical protein